MVGCPHICTPPVHLYAPHMFVHPHTFIHPPGVYTTPQGPPCSLCSCMVLEHCMLWGGVFLLNVYWDTPPLFGGASPLITPPTLHCWFSVHFYSQGYQFLCGPSPSMEGFGGVPPSLGWLGGTSALQLFTCSFLYFFCSALCLTCRPQLRLLLLQLQWYLLACHQCHQCQWLLP